MTRIRRIKLHGGIILEVSDGLTTTLHPAACVVCGRTVTADNERADHRITVPQEQGKSEATVLILKCEVGRRTVDRALLNATGQETP